MNKNKNFICCFYKQLKIIQLKRFLQNEIAIFPHLILMVNYFLKCEKIDFIFNIFSGFLFQFEACIFFWLTLLFIKLLCYKQVVVSLILKYVL